MISIESSSIVTGLNISKMVMLFSRLSVSMFLDCSGSVIVSIGIFAKRIVYDSPGGEGLIGSFTEISTPTSNEETRQHLEALLEDLIRVSVVAEMNHYDY